MNTSAIKIRPSILGDTYSVKAGCDYPVTILFMNGTRPHVIMGNGAMIPIDTPQRFGNWTTRAERREYITRFVARWDDDKARWDAIPCSDCGQPGDPCECES